MARKTLYFPEAFMKRLKEHPNVDWPSVIHSIIEKKLDELDNSAKKPRRKSMFGAAKGKLISFTSEDRWNDRD